MVAAEIYVSDEVLAVTALCESLFDEIYPTLNIREQLDRQARLLLSGLRVGDLGAAVLAGHWLPVVVGRPLEDILSSPLTLPDARLAVACEYGYQSWKEVLESGAVIPDPLFEAAVDTMLAGDVDGLNRLLEAHPHLATQRSTYGHRATLLHYLTANGVEIIRRQMPANADVLALTLIDAGAEVNATIDVFGGPHTPLSLLQASAHAAKAGMSEAVAAILRAAGAR